MTQKIGGVTLDNDYVWEEQKSEGNIISSTFTSLKGVEVIFEKEKTGWYPITLAGNVKSGWLKGSTVDSLRTLANVPGATYTLDLDGTEYTVRFRNELKAIEATLLRPNSNPGDDDWYFCKIRLMKV